MKKVIFTLDTTPTLFAQLLSDLTESVHVRRFPTEHSEPQYPSESKGYYVLQPVPSMDHDVGEQLPLFVVIPARNFPIDRR